MEAVSSALSRSLNYFTTIQISDVFDIILVAYLIYRAIWFVRTTSSSNMTKGVVVFLVALGLSRALNLTMVNTLLRKAVEIGMIAILIIFQPELRRVLEKMGSSFTSAREGKLPEQEAAIAQIVLACEDMSKSKTGALIIIERTTKLEEIMSTGTIVNADITAELLKNLFFNKAPLHDGAVIIQGTHIAAAGCVLPLTRSRNLSKDLGMRHRAGIGLSEVSDAVVVIVSEETGSISVATDGMLKRHLSSNVLNNILHQELVSDNENNATIGAFQKLFRLLKGKTNEENEYSKENH